MSKQDIFNSSTFLSFYFSAKRNFRTIVQDFVNQIDFDEASYLSYISFFYLKVSIPSIFSMYMLWFISIYHGANSQKRPVSNHDI